MIRPRKLRRIGFDPEVRYFKPQGVPLRFLEEIDLEADELEALRLCDFEDLEQTEAARKMHISQSTLQRILVSGRRKVTRAIVEAKAIRIKTIKNQQKPK